MTSVTQEELARRFQSIAEKACKLGVDSKDLANLRSLRNIQSTENVVIEYVKGMCRKFVIPAMFAFICLQVLLLSVWVFEWPMSRYQLISSGFNWYDLDITREPCIVPVLETVQDFVRPPVSCSICRGLKRVQKVSNLAKDVFEEKYAYTGIPVIVKDGAKNWTAVEHFNFNFFKNIYAADSPVLLQEESHCQFFPYKSNFNSLAEVFDMSEDRASLKDGTEPWYIGWSNCDSTAANVLRQHYDRPYFLPADAESSKTDWIFMGSPGYGAHMHIDNVGNPSWQAQITGTKQWTLEPPPECFYQCQERIVFVVEPGEIVVLDTNVWFHSTLILGTDMSITIGSEYD